MNLEIFIWLCIHPITKSTKTNLWMKYFRIPFVCTIIGTLILCIIGSILFVTNYVAIDLGGSLVAVLEIGALSSNLYSIIVAYVLQDKIINIFKHFKAILLTSKSSNATSKQISLHKFSDTDLTADSLGFWIKANQNSAFIFRLLMKYLVIIQVCSSALLSFASFSYCYFTKDHLTAKCLYNPYKFV